MSMFIPADRRSSVRSTRTPLQGEGVPKNGASTPCTGTCTRRSAAKPDRSVRGNRAGRQRLEAGMSAGCTAPAAGHRRTSGTATTDMGIERQKPQRRGAPLEICCGSRDQLSNASRTSLCEDGATIPPPLGCQPATRQRWRLVPRWTRLARSIPVPPVPYGNFANQ
jgi:hypothetical protein